MIKKTKLGNVADLSIGFVGTVTTQYEEGGIPFLRTLNVKPYKIVDDDLKRITRDFHESQKKSQLREGDVAMVHTGVPGICCVIPKEYDDSNCIDMIVIKPHRDMINPYYLAAYMNTVGYKHIEKKQVGCIQKHFNLKDANELDVYLPDIQTQNRIGELVEVINNKIENNIKAISILEDIVKTIYDYWFLQCDFPNNNHKPYKSSGGEMIWNEKLKREIPIGWEVSNLLDYCSWEGTSQPPKSCFIYEEREGYIRFIQNRDFEDDTHKTYIPRDKALGICDEYDILIDKYGDAGRTRFGLSGAYNVALSKISVTDMELREYIRFFLSSSPVYTYLHSSSMASTRASLNENNLSYLNILIPPKEVIHEFYNYAFSQINMALQKKKENRYLISIRNELLPLLFSGQIHFE